MKQFKFKVLTYANQYVDENKLSDGIYIRTVPFLHSINTTKESLIERAESVYKILNYDNVEVYISNLQKCELVEVELLH